MAASVAAPLERAVRDHRRHHLDDLDRRTQGIDARSRCSSTSTATSTARRSTCSRPSAPRLRRLPVGPAHPAELPQGQPGRPADPVPGADVDTLPLSTVNDFAETVLQQQISQIPGVAQVLIFGAQKYAVRDQGRSRRRSRRAGSTLDDMRNAVAAANSNQPVGTLRGERQRVTLEATGQMRRAADYGDLIVAWRNGAPVRLEDIADGRGLASRTTRAASWYNGAALADRRGVPPAGRQHGRGRRPHQGQARRLSRAAAGRPSGLNVLNDRSISIREAVHDVQFTLMLTIALVVLVIFLFLKSIAATIIPTLALPVSLIGTFAA